MSTTIDYTPLLHPVSPLEVAEFKRTSRLSGGPGSLGVGAILLLAGLGLVSLTAGVPALLRLIVFPGSADSSLTMLGGVAVVDTIAILLLVRSTRGYWERRLRTTRFASANGLAYLDRITEPRYPGMIFSVGRGRHTTGNYRRLLAPALDIGNYRYTTGSGKNSKTHLWGYVAMRLPRRLPHMLLDARSNNFLGISNLPSALVRSQTLSLEGDFDKYFTLYCPAEYETDALYIFTPDLMALLIDNTAAFDIEIVDDWMLLYSSAPLRLDDAATLHKVFTIAATVGEKARRQSTRYADERIGDRRYDFVAPQGQRLKRSWLRPLVTVGIILGVFWLIATVFSGGLLLLVR